MRRILNAFPNAPFGDLKVTSPPTSKYNCVAFAFGDDGRWWEPKIPYYWPPGVRRALTIEAWSDVAIYHGFEPCLGDSLEAGYLKVALFASNSVPTHFARQLPDGRWASKLGKHEDIQHSLRSLEGTEYGLVCGIFRKAEVQSPS